jgi:hypothetical protein
MYQTIGKRTSWWSGGAIVAREPSSALKFVLLNLNFSTLILGRKTKHQLGGEGPTLATEILDIANMDTRFLKNLASDGMLYRLASFDEASQA